MVERMYDNGKNVLHELQADEKLKFEATCENEDFHKLTQLIKSHTDTKIYLITGNEM